ncbi:type II secretion system F family protein [Mycetocola reblochoni]|uniref:Flp pilus assembly protein TadB n=2 Tax=Mycetocola reblochoni TaxID=331618 RepID=A0A1R4J9M5_9MICO|nr:type II secretion system F family protein [Mycetocola reblochoni]RLP70078.1 type II secretion protein F [Mycetocola reblochoni]SJN28758.1 Flp pilus assembly protein TadB [Mycetocola reblochoni REB411]
MTALALAFLTGTGAALLAWNLIAPRRSVSDRARSRASRRRVRAALAEAGLGRVPVPVALIFGVMLATLCAAVLGAVTGVPAVAGAGACLGVVIEVAWVRGRVRRTREARRAEWPDVIDQFVAELRAGRTIASAVGEVADSGPRGMRDGFSQISDEMTASGDTDTALHRGKGVFADPVADRLLETLRIARSVGGTDTVRVLIELGAYVRENEAVRREVHSTQAWVRNAAVLGAAAPWLILVLLSTRPETAAAYRSPAGTVLIVAGVALTLAAFAAMLAIGRLRDEQRWVG